MGRQLAWVVLFLARIALGGTVDTKLDEAKRAKASPEAASGVSPVGAPPPGSTRQVDLTKGVRQKLSGGLELELKWVMHAHLSGSRNHSMCGLTARRGSTTVEVQLERNYPGPHAYFSVLGTTLALDGVDGYHQPETAFLFVAGEQPAATKQAP